MDCELCKTKMKLVSTWVEDDKSLSEYKCDCGHVQTMENLKVEDKKETKVMVRQVPEWAHVHLTRLLQNLKERLPDNYENGKYTILLILWTDNTYQISIDSTEITDDGLIQHTFSWNKSTGYLDSRKIEGSDANE